MKHLQLYETFGINESEKKEKRATKKAMKDMSNDEKVAVYRAKISKERKNPAPDQAKIEDLKQKVSKLNTKKKDK